MVTHRIDVARARAEARFLRSKQFTCGRCREEVAPGAMWCPHCGFDMTVGGSGERVRALALPWESSFQGAPLHFVWGILAAAVVFGCYLLLSLRSGTTGNVFGCLAFMLALFWLSADLSVRGLLQTAPTLAASLVFLSVT